MNPLLLIDVTNIPEYLSNLGISTKNQNLPYHLEIFQRQFFSQPHIQELLRFYQNRGKQVKILIDNEDPLLLNLIDECKK
jgi:hypothetical protein